MAIKKKSPLGFGVFRLYTEREAFFMRYFDEDIENPELYDMVLNQGTLSMDLIVDLVASAMRAKGLVEPATKNKA